MPEASTAAATETVAWAPEPSELVGSGLLTAPLDASPALIYVKDRDGRYLRINRRFAECLGTSAERVLGRTDAELPTGETIDGPRLDTGTPSDSEPRQLEYIVGRFAKRPAFSVLRFTLVDHAGESIGTCGVAAPAGDGALARAECEQLMALVGMAPPVLVRPMGAPALEVARPAEPGVAVEPGQEGEAQADVRLTAALEHERARAERAERALVAERERAQQAEVALAQEREREQAATESLTRERARLEQAEETHRIAVAELSERLEVLQREGASAVDGAAMAAATAERARAEEEAVRRMTALEHERVRAERAETALTEERERSQRAETTLALASERQQAAGAALVQERERAQRAEEARGAAEAELAATRQQAEAELAAAREGASDLAHDASMLTRVQAELTAARQAADELEREREELTATLRAAKGGITAIAASDRLQWGATAQRALAMAVARSADWDSTLREATKTIGVEGGWHAAFAWAVDPRSKRLRCAASWIDPEAELGHFETATRQQMLTLHETRLGAAIHSGELRWIDDDPTGSERRWAAVQRQGMQLALLAPLRAADGPSIAVLELLSREPSQPRSGLDHVYEAIALELGHLCELLSLNSHPRWGFGRV